MKVNLILGIIIIAIDRIAKIIALQGNFQINYGVAFGLFSGADKIFLILLSLVILGFLLWLYRTRQVKQSKFLQLSLTFILAGLLSNLLDRIFYGFIIDFIKIFSFPAFNIADVSNFIGAVMLIFWLIKKR